MLATVALDTASNALAQSASAVIANWLRDPPAFEPELGSIVLDVLARRFPAYGAELATALSRGVSAYVSETAAAERLRREKAPSPRETLVAGALELLRDREPAVLRAALADAEAAFVRGRRPPQGSPLLEVAYRTRVHELLRACGGPTPPSDADVTELGDFLFVRPDERSSLHAIARLARAIAAAQALQRPATIAGFGDIFAQELAWGDLAARRVRDTVTVDEVARETVTALVDRWFALRDEWNRGFATLAARDWSKVMHGNREAGSLALHRVLGEVVRPLVQVAPGGSGRRHVFFVVLDGCDLPSFYEIVRALEQRQIAPILPPGGVGLPLLAAQYGDVLGPHVALGIAPMPTITSHARRAIFAGMIPDAVVIDEREAFAAASSADGKAFERCVALGSATRKLFLKGDRADSGVALEALLGSPQMAPDVVAAVFNEVDDALSSKQSGVLPPWQLGNLGAIARALTIAVRNDWTIILTADHGHTPFREPDLRAAGFTGSRYVELPDGPAPVPQSVVFEKGSDVPRRLAVLYRVGEHGAPAHVGYHGGASLEEVFVPIVCLGSGMLDPRAISEPAWWSGIVPDVGKPPPRAVSEQAKPRASKAAVQERLLPTRSVAAKATAELLEQVSAILSARNAAIVASIAEYQVLDAAGIAKAHALKPGLVPGRIDEIVATIEAAGLPDCIAIDSDRRRYSWRG